MIRMKGTKLAMGLNVVETQRDDNKETSPHEKDFPLVF